MDDTQQSRVSDAAAATRKRRSSILKSQRPPRTPFSELEFNVATPTDTAKSRRVSFSRRTGVAEFVTNEATTTWKNFYEEHNKSLESSGNESAANPPRPTVGHIGKRIFDQQFQEVEAVDFVSTLNINTSMNNVNFTQQLASLECTGDEKLSMPQQNLEMSAFTDHQSKLFGDDLAIPAMGEMSGRIDVNFSTIQPIGDLKDDLDAIQEDLQRQSNVVCAGPFSSRKSLSEYIEVDLNATHVSIRNDEDDMSITDTIHSPKVQDVSKNCSSSQNDKKSSFNQDWVADKENIALNPYVTPKEATNFAINDESDKILVFDGKRLTISSDKEADVILKGKDDFKPPKEAKPHQRKTIVLNVNDDLPNFVDDPMSTSTGLRSGSFKHSVMYYDDDISITNPLLTNVNAIPEGSINFTKENETGNISLTQAVNNVILPPKAEKRRTIVFENDNCDISMTQALPSKIIGTDKVVPERRRTILYENDAGNISITQAVPVNIITRESTTLNRKRETLVFDNIEGDISMTQAIPANLILSTNVDASAKFEPEKSKTIVFDNENCDISMTQTLPSKCIAFSENKPDTGRRKTILYDNDMGNISVTQAIPSNILLSQRNDKNKTVVFDDVETDISMTQAIPTNLLLTSVNRKSLAESEKRKTIVFEDEDCDISVTRALPANIIIPNVKSMPLNIVTNENQDLPSKSIDQNIIEQEKRKTIIDDCETGNMSVTQAIPLNILVNNTSKLIHAKSKNLFESTFSGISETPNIPTNFVMSLIADGDKNKTVTAVTDITDISITSAVSTNLILPEKPIIMEKPITIVDTNSLNLPQNVLVPGDSDTTEKRKTLVPETKIEDSSETKALVVNVLTIHSTNETRKSVMDTDVRDIVSDSRKSMKENNCESISHGADVQDEVQGISDAILLEKDKTISEINDLLNNKTINEMSIVKDNIVDEIKDVNGKDQTINQVNNVTLGQNHIENVIMIMNETHKIDKSVVKDNTVNEIDIMNDDNDNSIKIVDDMMDRSEDKIEHSIMKNRTINLEDDITKDQTLNKTEQHLINNQTIHEIEDDVMHDSEHEIELDILKDRTMPIINNDTVGIKNDASKIRSVTINSPQVLTDNKDAIDDNDGTSNDSLIYITRDIGSETQTEKEEEKPNKTLKWKDDMLTQEHSPISIDYNEEIDKEVMVDLTKDDDEDIQKNNPHYEEVQSQVIDNKSIELESKEIMDVCKKLQFEDDSASDTNVMSELNLSPLKKTAFNEEVNMKDVNKSNVIPTYLKDVSDGLKSLMSDLIKPNCYVGPLEKVDGSLRNDPSTCSTQIQTNLITSSQIELDSEPVSSSESAFDIKTVKNRSFSPNSANRNEIPAEIMFQMKRLSNSPPKPQNVVIFDHENPLNNVLITPMDTSDAHKYNPTKSSDPISKTPSISSEELDVRENVPTQIVGIVSVTETNLRSSQIDKFGTRCAFSNTSQQTIDESMSTGLCELKDRTVNTLIAMKANKDLLEASSSLTLVDDSVTEDFDMDTLSPVSDAKSNSSPKEQNVLSTDTTTIGKLNESLKSTMKGKKRIYSPAKRDPSVYSTIVVDVTPKPTTKMQKLSSSPITHVDAEISPLLGISSQKSQGTDIEVTQNKERNLNSKSLIEDSASNKEKKSSPRKSLNSNANKTGNSLNLSPKSHGNGTGLSHNKEKNINSKSVTDGSPNNEERNSSTRKSMSSNINNTRNSPNASPKSHGADIDLTKNINLKSDTNDSPNNKERKSSSRKSISFNINKTRNSLNMTTNTHAADFAQTQNIEKNTNSKTVIDDSPNNKVNRSSQKFMSINTNTAKSDVDYEIAHRKPDEHSDRKPNEKQSKRKSLNPKSNKPSSDVTVDQLIAEYNIQTKIDESKLNKDILEALSRSNSLAVTKSSNADEKVPELVTSFTSSKNLNDMREVSSVSNTEMRTNSSRRSTDLESEVSETCKNPIYECDSSVNVVAKIDMLPFMGSHECEWEASGVDTWAFRLLYARLRLIVRLAHRHENASRSRVRADTPVISVALHTPHKDKKNTVASICVGFACEAMRCFVARGCKRAGDVPTLLRRCAAVARVALRWGRAMHEARLHTAYSLTNDGNLTLKVANIPLRSVWEVSMRLELVVENELEVPWPRVCDVIVTTLVSDVQVTPDEIKRCLASLPRDWGHVPRAVWKIFRYLKNKTRDDDLLGL